MSDVIEVYYEKQRKKGKRGGLNLPAMARKEDAFQNCIQADDGKVFFSQDVVSLEPSITAEMSQDPMYMYATVTGIGQRPHYKGNILMIDDIYLMSASMFPTTRDAIYDIFHNHTMPTGLSFADQWMIDSEVCKDYTKKAVRNFAKVACLGIGYGMGWRKFQTTSEENGKVISVQESKGVIKSYWDGYEGLKALRDWASWEVKKKGSIVNPFGYRCTPDPHKAFNAYIQSSASGVLDVYCLKLFSICSWAEFVALIHDEVIFMIPEDKQDELKKISEEVVRSLNEDLGWTVPIRFGTKISKTFKGFK